MPQFLLKREALVESKDKASWKGAKFRLTGSDAFHIAKVLRHRAGDSVELFDGHGGHFSATLSQVAADAVEGVIVEERPAPPAAKVRLHLYPGLLKATAWEWVLEKGTELGAVSFTPVVTPRTVVMLERERVEAKRDRWLKLVQAAAKQCGRGDLPEVKPPLRFPEAIREATERGLTLFAAENMKGAASRESIGDGLARARAAAKGPVDVNLFVGPEGGFSVEEVELAEAREAILFGLGANTLRAETAVLAASTAVLYELGVL
ncbi:MAG: 16S rRNA (uracil(1498)-N(3))-methyltransferase [Elusimicrobia bacterium]|nr:16S rRNA (uracil(1498)-N(3))-methyltransferase [Elusimicrobiota bacterium]